MNFDAFRRISTDFDAFRRLLTLGTVLEQFTRFFFQINMCIVVFVFCWNFIDHIDVANGLELCAA